jgi:hypothetical protein
MAWIHLSRYEAEEGDLPDVCMRCGAPATVRKRRRFTSHPLWVYLLIPLGLLPYVIVAIILTEEVPCYTQFCPRHRHHWLFRGLLVWVGFVVILAIIIGSSVLLASMSDQLNRSTEESLAGLLCVGSVILMLCWFISIPITQLTAIHPTDATDRGLTLKNVSPAFVEAVRAYRASRSGEEQLEVLPADTPPRRSPSPEEGFTGHPD